MYHLRRQFPVGHGGFHAGVVGLAVEPSPGTLFHYVYDCGGQGKSVLKDRIDTYVSQVLSDDQLDALFLSHLHWDHVGGVPNLLSRTRPKYVFLPFLEPIEQLALVAEYANKGTSGSAMKIAVDPQKYFLERADIVVFVRSGGPDRSARPIDLPEALPTEPRQPDWNVRVEEESISPGTTAEDAPHAKGKSATMLDSNPVRVGQEWVFVTYVAMSNDPRRQIFETLVQARFPVLWAALQNSANDWVIRASELTKVVEDDDELTDLASCYRGAFGNTDFNRTSLCLLSSAVHPRFGIEDLDWPSDTEFWRHASRNRQRLGKLNPQPDGFAPRYLMTGDAKLGSPDAVSNLAHHYQGYIDRIDTLQIPHHGSIADYCDDLIHTVRPVCVFICGPEPKRKPKKQKHPDPQVIAQLRSLGYTPIIVAKHDGGLIMRFGDY